MRPGRCGSGFALCARAAGRGMPGELARHHPWFQDRPGGAFTSIAGLAKNGLMRLIAGMSMYTKAAWEIVRKRKACEKKAQELVEQAGIAEEVAAARGPHHPLHWDSDAPYGSEQADHENAEYWEDQRRTTAYRLRKVFFSVSDAGMRKRLIAKEREIENLRRELFTQEVLDANVALEKARIPRPKWWIVASILGTILIAGGYKAFGTPGAIGGALIGFFIGLVSPSCDSNEWWTKTRKKWVT
jgi:hypothetical protein